mmetsp:Transcript_10275/g.27966  ORF Transcript_10275/g.27966 Transcript_10275/m.27966 type:complete len:103 (+) Transcript_10275:188-496(+)
MFKVVLAVVAFCAATAQGFVSPAVSRSAVGRSAVRMETARINNDIDLESEKVVNMLELDGKKVFCRCWKSGTFPLCDGAHMKHNEATGDNVGPLIVSLPKDK